MHPIGQQWLLGGRVPAPVCLFSCRELDWPLERLGRLPPGPSAVRLSIALHTAPSRPALRRSQTSSLPNLLAQRAELRAQGSQLAALWALPFPAP